MLESQNNGSAVVAHKIRGGVGRLSRRKVPPSAWQSIIS